MNKKKLLVVLLTLTMLLGMTGFAGATPPDENISDDDVVMPIALLMQMNAKSLERNSGEAIRPILGRNALATGQLILSFVDAPSAETQVTGTMWLNGQMFSIAASGELEYYDVQQTDDFAFGIFSGYLLQNGIVVESIMFDIKYDTATKEASASSMTIGAFTDDEA